METTLLNIVSICIGASLGALLRWQTNLLLNTKTISLASIPLGTLTVNWLGAWIIGLCIVFFESATQISPAWRLAIVTGFLGALTTFSTFSAEVIEMLMHGRFLWAIASSALHLFGSLAFTFFGVWCARSL